MALYLQGEVGYTRVWTEGIRGDEERFTSSQEGVSANIRPGISFFVSEHLAFINSQMLSLVMLLESHTGACIGGQGDPQPFDKKVGQNEIITIFYTHI